MTAKPCVVGAGAQGSRVIFRIVRLENGKRTTVTMPPARARRIAARIFQSAAEIDPDGTELLEDSRGRGECSRTRLTRGVCQPTGRLTGLLPTGRLPPLD